MGNYYGLLTYDDSDMSDSDKKKIESGVRRIIKYCHCREVDHKIPETMNGVKVKLYTKTFLVLSVGELSPDVESIYKHRAHNFLVTAVNYIRETGIEKYEIYTQRKQES